MKIIFNKYLIFNILFFILCTSTKGQSIVINEYFNAADARDEWVELVVVDDDVDARLWTIRDNTTAQTSWQSEVTFANVPFWNHLRRGTIIILRCRSLNSSAVNYAVDSSKNDGFIDVNLQEANLFSGGGFGVSPTFGGTTMSIGGTGDIVQLRNSAGTHIHALGHKITVGADWTALPTPKLNHAATISTGDGVYVCPGRALANFDGASGTTLTAKGTAVTEGLPNSCSGFTTENKKFIDSLRKPIFTTQIVPIDSAEPGKIEFNWTAMANAVAADTSMGYIVVRYNKDSFTAPAAGTSYTKGDLLGKALIVGKFNSVDSITMKDTNNIVEGGTYFYRVYGYRYIFDDVKGNNFNTSRGTFYDTTNYVTAQILYVLNLNATINFVKNIECFDTYYKIELQNLPFYPSSVVIDNNEELNPKINFVNEYTASLLVFKTEILDTDKIITIKLQNANGQTEEIFVAIPNNLCDEDFLELSIAPNPTHGYFQIFGLPTKSFAEITVYDFNGNLVLQKHHFANGGSIDLNYVNSGVYLVKAIYSNKVQYLKVYLER